MANHGGNVYRFARESGRSLTEMIDFSASINPLGPPACVRAAIISGIPYLCHYPDPEATVLTQALARIHSIDPEQLICGNGSTELIYLLTRVLRPGAVLLPAPAFLEYERASRISFRQARIAGTIRRLALLPGENFAVQPDRFIAAMTALDSSSGRLAFLCNPNNPTGSLMSRADVLAIAAAARDLKCHLVVDEAFMDFVADSQSVVDQVADNPCLIVLRSLTKFYAIPGLRIGFGVFPLHLVREMRDQQEPWTVNALAQQAAAAALADSAYRTETLAAIASGKKILAEGFEALGITYFPAAANYFLIRHPRAPEILAALRNKGIMLRDCANFPGLDESYLRVAVRTERENKRLLQEMEAVCRGS